MKINPANLLQFTSGILMVGSAIASYFHYSDVSVSLAAAATALTGAGIRQGDKDGI